MTATALRGHTDRRPERDPNPMRGIHPDVLAVTRDLGVTRPRTIWHYQQVYDRMIAASIRDAADGLRAYILTYADPTGETAVRGNATKRRRPA